MFNRIGNNIVYSKKVSSSGDMAKAYQKQLEQQKKEQEKLNKLNNQFYKLKADRDYVIEMFNRGIINQNEANKRISKIDKEIEKLNKKAGK